MAHLKTERDGVDGDDVFASEVLQRSGKERLREKEPRDPEYLQHK